MREVLARWLYALAVWLWPNVAESPAHEPAQWGLVQALVARAEHMAAGTTGEYKRAWVYGKLQKAFPTEKKTTLALLIEHAVRDAKR